MSAAAILMLLRRPYCGPVYQHGPVHCTTPSTIRHIETGCILRFDMIKKHYRGFYEKEGLRYSLIFCTMDLEEYEAKGHFEIIDDTPALY